MKIGICSGPQDWQAFADAGGDFIEAHVQAILVPTDDDDAFAEQRKAIDACSIPVSAANCFLPESLPSTGARHKPQPILDYASTAFRRAQQVGIGTIVFGSGGSRKLDDGFPHDEATDQFVSLCRELGPIAAAHDVTVVIEPLRRAECNFINTIAEGADIVSRVGHSCVQLLADVYHMACNDDPPEAIVDAGTALRHVHVAEPGDRTCPGIEGFDFGPYLRALKQANYAGPISIEAKFPDGVATNAPQVLDQLRRQCADAGLAAM